MGFRFGAGWVAERKEEVVVEGLSRKGLWELCWGGFFGVLALLSSK